MNPAIISALAALGGSSVGAIAPVLSNYVFQRSLARRELLNRQVTLRETLYSEFIKEASHAYADSMTHSLDTFDELVALYALVSRIRLLASKPVLHAAEAFVRQIVLHYGETNMSVEELRAAAMSSKADPLDVFSTACRTELQEILRRGVISSAVHY